MEKYPWKFELPIKLDNGKKIKLIWLFFKIRHEQSPVVCLT